MLQKGKACDPASGKLGEVTVARGFSVSADFEKDVEETRAASFISNSIGSIDASPPRCRPGARCWGQVSSQL